MFSHDQTSYCATSILRENTESDLTSKKLLARLLSAAKVAPERNMWANVLVGMLCFIAINYQVPVYGEDESIGIQVHGTWSAVWPAHHEEHQDMMFDAFVSSNRYFFAIEHRLGPRGEWYLIDTSDGIDSFGMYNPLSWKQPAAFEPKANTKAQAFGYVHSGVFPSEQPLIVQLLWLAYAFPFQTNVLLKAPTDALIQPLVGNDLTRPSAWIMEVDQWDPGRFSCLKRLAFYQPSRGVMPGMTNEYFLSPQAYTNGMLFADFQVVETTNINGTILPLSIHYRDFFAAQHRTATNRDDVDLKSEVFVHLSVGTLGVDPPYEYPPVADNSLTTLADTRIKDFKSEPLDFTLGPGQGFLRRGSAQFHSAESKVLAEIRRKKYAKLSFIPVFLLFCVPLVPIMIKRIKEQRANDTRLPVRTGL